MKLLLAIVVAAAAAVAVAERGEEVKLDGLNTYTYTSGAANATAVILASDIFGYTLPRLREIADKVAGARFYAVVPDFFRGAAFIHGWSYKSWIIAHPPEMGIEDAKVVVEALKSKGITKIGGVDFCWGRKVVVDMLKDPLVQAGVLCAATATAVILVPNIFGYTLPRLREIADKVYRVGKGLPFNLGQLVLREIADKNYRVGKDLPFNLGQLVFDAVIKAASDSEGLLLYPNIILQILVKQAVSDSEGPLLYPNIIFQILVKEGYSAKASSDCVLPPVLIFSKTLFTSNRFKDLPYTSSVSSDDEDSTFEAIRNYRDSEAGDVGPSSTSSILAVQKILSSLPDLIKKAEGLLHSLKDAQDIVRKVTLFCFRR